MTTDIVTIAHATGYDQNKVQLVKDTIAKGASDDELMLFLHLAQRTGLDPFTRQIYLIERSSQVDGKWITSRQPQTGIDGLRLIAERSDCYAPGKEPAFEYDADGRLVKATSYVKKWVRGEWHEVAASAHYDEYVQRKKDGNPTKFWAEKPHIMLAKCAEALALRRAFPADMGRLYTDDEMGTVEVLPARPAADPETGEVITAPRAAHPKLQAAPQRNGADKTKYVNAVRAFIDCAEAIGIEVADIGNLDTYSVAQLTDAGQTLRSAIVTEIGALAEEAGEDFTVAPKAQLMKMKPDELQTIGQRLIAHIAANAPVAQQTLVEVEAVAHVPYDGELAL